MQPPSGPQAPYLDSGRTTSASSILGEWIERRLLFVPVRCLADCLEPRDCLEAVRVVNDPSSRKRLTELTSDSALETLDLVRITRLSAVVTLTGEQLPSEGRAACAMPATLLAGLVELTSDRPPLLQLERGLASPAAAAFRGEGALTSLSPPSEWRDFPDSDSASDLPSWMVLMSENCVRQLAATASRPCAWTACPAAGPCSGPGCEEALLLRERRVETLWVLGRRFATEPGISAVSLTSRNSPYPGFGGFASHWNIGSAKRGRHRPFLPRLSGSGECEMPGLTKS